MSGDGSTRHDAALLDEFFRSGERRENDAFGEGTSGLFSKWLACLVVVEFNEIFHGVSLVSWVPLQNLFAAAGLNMPKLRALLLRLDFSFLEGKPLVIRWRLGHGHVSLNRRPLIGSINKDVHLLANEQGKIGVLDPIDDLEDARVYALSTVSC